MCYKAGGINNFGKSKLFKLMPLSSPPSPHLHLSMSLWAQGEGCWIDSGVTWGVCLGSTAVFVQLLLLSQGGGWSRAFFSLFLCRLAWYWTTEKQGQQHMTLCGYEEEQSIDTGAVVCGYSSCSHAFYIATMRVTPHWFLANIQEHTWGSVTWLSVRSHL